MVEVTSATPLDAASEQQRHPNACKPCWAANRSWSGEVDPDLIGGIVLRVGDTVYDGSVATQLEQLREQMIDRSVHEIQSRRDRFRHSDGN